MDSVRSGSYGQLFRPDNFVFGKLRTYSYFEFYLLFRCHILYLNNLQIRLYFGFIVFARKGLIDKQPNLVLMFLSVSPKFRKIRIIN